MARGSSVVEYARNSLDQDTEIPKEIYTIKWTISKFVDSFILHFARKKVMKSPCFNIAGETFHLRVSQIDSALVVTLQPEVDVEQSKSLFAICRFYAIGAREKYYKSMPSHLGENLSCVLMPITKAFGLARSEPGGDLILMAVFETFLIDEDDLSSYHGEKNEMVKLSSDLKSLRQNETFSDVTLLVGGEEFRVHKAILAARSPVFLKMFQSRMEEAQHNIVVIPDVSAAAMKVLIEYLYCGQPPKKIIDVAYEVYSAADKYDVQPLHKMMSWHLMSNLDYTNVCPVLKLAILHSDSVLEFSAKQYIFNHACEVLDSEQWKDFVVSNPSLASQVLVGYERFRKNDEQCNS